MEKLFVDQPKTHIKEINAMNRQIEIGYHLGIQLIQLCGMETAKKSLKEAGSRNEARGIFRAISEALASTY